MNTYSLGIPPVEIGVSDSMTQRKRNESEVSRMFRAYGWNVRKGRDRGYIHCPHCHTPVKTCPTCKGDLLLNKAEKMADYLVSIQYFDLEAKDGGDRFSVVDDISPTQREVLGNSKDGWIYIQMGEGMAGKPWPNGRESYLIPWPKYVEIEQGLLDNNNKSFVYESGVRGRTPQANEIFKEYQCVWEKGGWIIPPSHPFWLTHGDHIKHDQPDLAKAERDPSVPAQHTRPSRPKLHPQVGD